jgi:hypothetical protein
MKLSRLVPSLSGAIGTGARRFIKLIKYFSHRLLESITDLSGLPKATGDRQQLPLRSNLISFFGPSSAKPINKVGRDQMDI